MALDFAPSLAPTGGWRRAIVRDIAHPTPRGVRIRFEVPNRVEHMVGQHYVVRLTAQDGYRAQRSYSVASPPSDPLVELFVERLDDGEVSTFLADELQLGDEIELRGPIGGWFVWDGHTPAIAVGAGSGVVPLVAMLRHGTHLGNASALRIAVSSRTYADLPYADELMAAGAAIALTREDAPTRGKGRLTTADLQSLVAPRITGYICGSAQFAEAATDLLVAVGVDPALIRVERFGPSG